MDKKQELYDKLKDDLQEAKWDVLADHHQRGAVFILAPEIDIIEVGAAVAVDEVELIKKLLDEKKLSRPDDEEVKTYNKENTSFQFLIVQPYVFIQRIKLH